MYFWVINLILSVFCSLVNTCDFFINKSERSFFGLTGHPVPVFISLASVP